MKGLIGIFQEFWTQVQDSCLDEQLLVTSSTWKLKEVTFLNISQWIFLKWRERKGYFTYYISSFSFCVQSFEVPLKVTATRKLFFVTLWHFIYYAWVLFKEKRMFSRCLDFLHFCESTNFKIFDSILDIAANQKLHFRFSFRILGIIKSKIGYILVPVMQKYLYSAYFEDWKQVSGHFIILIK